MQFTTRGVRLGAMGVTVALAAVACGGSSGGSPTTGSSSRGGSAAKAEGKTGGTLNILMSADFEHLDPQRTYVTDASDFGRLIYRTLTTYKSAPGKDGTDVVGDLAKDLGKASDDAKTWTFTLKDGLKYEDGSPITAADVKYGVERSFSDQLPEGAPYARQFLDCKDYKGPYADTSGQGCSAITTNGDKEITFKLNQPVGDFYYTVALPIFSPVPKAKDTKVNYDNRPFSSGPYKIENYDRGKSMTLVRNDQWDPKTDEVRGAYPDMVKVTQGIDPATIDTRLITDSGDDQTAIPLDTSIAPENLARVLNDPAVKQRSDSGLSNAIRYLSMRTDKAPFNDVKVRQAMNYLVDKEAYRTARGGPNAGDFATTIMLPTLAGYKKFDLYPADPTGDVAKAKELLKGTACENGCTVTLTTTNKGKGVTTAEAIQASLARGGIKVNINQVEGSVYYTTIGDKSKESELVFYGWVPDWPSGSTQIPPLFDGDAIVPQGNNNVPLYDNPEVNKKIDEIRAITDPEKAAPMWGELDETIMKDAPIVPLIYDKVLLVHGSQVKNTFLHYSFGGLYDLVALSVA